MAVTKKLLSKLPRLLGGCPHCAQDHTATEHRNTKLIIVGSPNVGKSVVFNALTGSYVTVSNYPGTTVEVSRGRGRMEGQTFDVVDTPGMYSLSPITEEERVTRQLLLRERPEVVLQVVDAKNLQRSLPLTLSLIEAGLPVLLDLNILDEAEELGIQIDVTALEAQLGVPVVATVSTTGRGMEELRARITQHPNGRSQGAVEYGPAIIAALEELEALLEGEYALSTRAIALLLLQDDEDIAALVQQQDAANRPRIAAICEQARAGHTQPLSYVIARRRQAAANEIVSHTATPPTREPAGFRQALSRAMARPLTGVPILLFVLYFGLYQFVGVFGAGTLVDLLESKLFDEHLLPSIVAFFNRWVPWPTWNSLFVGDYGIITLGMKYAVAIILPIVATFFLVFSVIEDSGYLPRLALLIDRIFKRIGLSGRAVIPMVLGFGCDTMATMVTRVLETRRERIIATLLLALAIPCSAQLGVILALLSHNPLSLAIWVGVVGGIFLVVGYLSSRLIPGPRPSFFMEVPPLRLPKLSNVVVKTYTRVEWYFVEIFPLFIFISVLIWLGQLTRVFDLTVAALTPVVNALGLPDQAAVAFLFGFFRRDYGAAGLYDLHTKGVLSGVPLLVSMVTMTLFLPCVAQFLIMKRERGLKAALAMSVLIFVLAFGTGYALNLALRGLGVSL